MLRSKGSHHVVKKKVALNDHLNFKVQQLKIKNQNRIFHFKNKIPTWRHLLFYFTYVLNVFRILIYPSSGACGTAAPNLQHTTNREKKTTDVVIQQHSHKLLMIDILISETCWVHNKWNKIASDIKLLFYSSTIKMMHGSINIRIFQS